MKTHTFPSTSNEGGLGDTCGSQVFRNKKNDLKKQLESLTNLNLNLSFHEMSKTLLNCPLFLVLQRKWWENQQNSSFCNFSSNYDFSKYPFFVKLAFHY